MSTAQNLDHFHAINWRVRPSSFPAPHRWFLKPQNISYWHLWPDTLQNIGLYAQLTLIYTSCQITSIRFSRPFLVCFREPLVVHNILLKIGANLEEIEDSFSYRFMNMNPFPIRHQEFNFFTWRMITWKSSSSLSFVSSLSLFVPSFTGLKGSCSFPVVLETFPSFWTWNIRHCFHTHLPNHKCTTDIILWN